MRGGAGGAHESSFINGGIFHKLHHGPIHIGYGQIRLARAEMEKAQSERKKKEAGGQETREGKVMSCREKGAQSLSFSEKLVLQ